MFEWPKAEEGEVIVSLPFKIFWRTSIPLAAVTGIIMWLISRGDKRGWETLSPVLIWRSLRRRVFGHQPRNHAHAPGSGSSQLSSNPKNPSSNAHGDVTPPKIPPHGAKDKINPDGNRGAVQRWFRGSQSRKQATDVESSLVTPHQK
jgi:hypothetical protein